MTWLSDFACALVDQAAIQSEPYPGECVCCGPQECIKHAEQRRERIKHANHSQPASTVTMHLGDDTWHDGPGWYYTIDGNPNEGSCGAFASRSLAVADASRWGWSIRETDHAGHSHVVVASVSDPPVLTPDDIARIDAESRALSAAFRERTRAMEGGPEQRCQCRDLAPHLTAVLAVVRRIGGYMDPEDQATLSAADAAVAGVREGRSCGQAPRAHGLPQADPARNRAPVADECKSSTSQRDSESASGSLGTEERSE